MRLFAFLLLLNFNAIAGGGNWFEIGDAPSFPDGQAQVTRGQGLLTTLSGATTATIDRRDSYCIKITDPDNFRATTDANSDPLASATFDTRLYLFDKRGTPVLYNDDTVNNTAPFHSTITGTASDGSNFVLSQGGEYVLVVGGFSDDAFDNSVNNVFNTTGNSSSINAANSSAGHFNTWENGNPNTGDYTLALQGISFCQDKLDIIGTGVSLTNDSQMCIGDGEGGFTSCNNDSIDTAKKQIVTGYLDSDAHLDVIFDKFDIEDPTICLGNGNGGYQSCSLYNDVANINSDTPILGDINNDSITDAVFIVDSENHKACLGDGFGSFINCTDISNTDSTYANGAQLSYIDADNKLDLIFTTFNLITLSSTHICLGNGLGGFNACINASIDASVFEVADFNNDGSSDIIALKGLGIPNNICLNNGSGGFSCNSISASTNNSKGVAIGDLNNDGNYDSVIANFFGLNQVCLGVGNGTFNCSNVSDLTGNYTAVKLGLLNDDNFLDAVFAGNNSFTQTCLGNGDGSFNNCVTDTSLDFFDIELGEFGEAPNELFSDGFE